MKKVLNMMNVQCATRVFAGLAAVTAMISAQSVPLPSERSAAVFHDAVVRSLTDATYDQVIGQTKGLAMVWFYKPAVGVNEVGLLDALGPRTNRFQFFRVDREANPVLWERILSGELAPAVWYSRGFNGDRRVVNSQVVAVMLLFGGREVAEFESGPDIALNQLDGMIARWIDHDTRRLKRRHQDATHDIGTAIGNGLDASFFCEALVQIHVPGVRNSGYLGECRDLWKCLECYEPVADLARVLPQIEAHLNGVDSIQASKVLARFGDRGEPAVDTLVAIIAELVRQVDEKPKVNGAEWDERWELQKRATAAAYALGGIGPEARAAVPLLTRIAKSEYGRMATGGPHSRVGNAKYGWNGALALQCAISLNRIQPPPTPGKDAGEYAGRSLRVWSQEHEPEEMKDVAMVFWKGRDCYETTSGTDGAYSIKLPPGRYLMQHGHYLPEAEPEFEMRQEPEMIEVVKRRKVERNIAAETIFVDYGHSALYELHWKDTSSNPAQEWMSDEDLRRFRGIVEKVAGPGEDRGYMGVQRGKGGRVFLEFSAFGPKYAAEAAEKLEQQVIPRLSTNTLVSVSEMKWDFQQQREMERHWASWSVGFSNPVLATTNDVRDAVAAALEPVLRAHRFRAHSRLKFDWDSYDPQRVNVKLGGVWDGKTLVELTAMGLEPAAWAEHIEPEFQKALDACKDVTTARR